MNNVAMNAERLLAHYDRIADAPDAVARLRRFILDLAVRGKLVPQDPNDEPASELLKRIAKEKARLVKAGEIRTPKASGPIRDDELPIPLPQCWGWARLCDIGKLSGGMTPSMNRSEFWDGDIVWLSPKDIKSDEVADSELKISAIGLAETRLELYRQGCLFMVARSGILKRTFPVTINRVPAAANQDMKVLTPFLDGQERYLQIMFRGLTDFLLRELVKTGTTVQSLKYAEFEQQPFPLPPLAEQHRIVAKVDELMALCDRLEAARAGREGVRDRLAAASLARLNTPDPATFQADARFALDALPPLTTRPDQIKALRQTILNLAVHGKLAPQDAKDEPATELLKRIAKEKARLVKAGEIRDKPSLPAVANADMPFPIPSAWVWVRFANIVDFSAGRTPLRKETSFWNNGDHAWVSIADMEDGQVLTATKETVSDKARERVFGSEPEAPGTILMSFKLTIGKIARLGVPAFHNEAIISIRPHLAELDAYLFKILPQFARQGDTKGAIKGATLNRDSISNILFPLPPLAEQHRIVAKVDAVMALCDRLEASLTAIAATRRRLLDALLAEALAPVDAREMEAAE